jgi:hypothetical protein
MNKRIKTAARARFTLGDLIVAVSSSTRDSREAAIAIADMLQSGRVVLDTRRRSRRRHS